MSSQISRPVVRSCTAGLGRVVELLGNPTVGGARGKFLGRIDGSARIPSLAGVSTKLAPSARSIPRRSRLIDSGIVSVNRYRLAAATKARAMPVLPLVRLDDLGLLANDTGLFGGLDHCPAGCGL